MTSSVTWPFDSPYAISYWWSIGTEPLSPTVFEIFWPRHILVNPNMHTLTNKQHIATLPSSGKHHKRTHSLKVKCYECTKLKIFANSRWTFLLFFDGKYKHCVCCSTSRCIEYQIVFVLVRMLLRLKYEMLDWNNDGIVCLKKRQMRLSLALSLTGLPDDIISLLTLYCHWYSPLAKVSVKIVGCRWLSLLLRWKYRTDLEMLWVFVDVCVKT